MSQYNFHDHYKGPKGAHLSCMTKFTRSKELNATGTMHPTGRHKRLHLRLALDKKGNHIPICGPKREAS